MNTSAGLALLALVSAAAPSFSWAAEMTVAPAASIRPVVSVAPLSFSWTKDQAFSYYTDANRNFWSSVNAVSAIPPEQRTFANTIGALEDARARYEETVGPTGFLSEVSLDPEVRAALAGQMVPVLERDPGAYRAVQEYAARGEPLTGADKLLLEEMQRDFRLDGKGLKDADVDRMQKLRVRLGELQNYFGRNVWDDKSAVTAAPTEMAGLPAELLAGLKTSADGSVAFPVNSPPTYRALMASARSPELRRRAELAHDLIGSAFNGQDLDEALALRREQAQLLKSKSYAHLAMEGRSVKSPWTIARLLYRMRGALIPAVRRENAELLALKQQDEPGASRLERWDVDFYTRRLLDRRGFDEKEARAYFPTESAIEAVLRRLEPALGIRFVEQPSASWHSSVRLFAVHDADGRRLASFYLDAYEREGKTGGRFVQALVHGRELTDGAYREPIFAVVTNFSPARDGQPSRLSHEELVGLLHELGHVLDDTLTQARYARFSGGGFGSGLDRGEIASQLLEQFAWDPAFVTSISGRDGDPARPIPAPLLNAMLDYSRVGRARTILAWTARAALDLALHALRPPADAARLVDKIFARFGMLPLPAGHMYQASFGHLMGSYAAGYYTYLLSLNRALDLFSRFERRGLTDPSVGGDYRSRFLAPGGERDLDDAARAFLGRDPDPRALERFLKTL